MRDNSKNSIKRALKKTGVRPTKKRGQNFLSDESFIDKIITFSECNFQGPVVEIGPGLGALTEKLSSAKKLTLIEIEPEFCRELKLRYPDSEIINQDIRKVDFSRLGKGLFVFGNVPYVYSTDIVFCLIEYRQYISSAVLLLQKEFSERLAASPGGRDYGVISINSQLFCDMELGAVIKGDNFVPPAKVDSRLIKLTFLEKPRHEVKNYEFFKKVVKASFIQRRKKLVNSLAGSGFFSKEKIHKALIESGIDGTRRAETLTIGEFIKLAEALA